MNDDERFEDLVRRAFAEEAADVPIRDENQFRARITVPRPPWWRRLLNQMMPASRVAPGRRPNNNHTQTS